MVQIDLNATAKHICLFKERSTANNKTDYCYFFFFFRSFVKNNTSKASLCLFQMIYKT